MAGEGFPLYKMNRQRIVKREEPGKHFSRIKIKDQIFTPGDTVCIQEYSYGETYATILSLSGTKSDPQMTVRWFYTVSDVFLCAGWPLSRYELFDSDHEDQITAMSINRKIQVLSITQFMQLNPLYELPEDIFYTRAVYLHTVMELVPPMKEWGKVCSCRAILSTDCIYRVCTVCRQSFHLPCVDQDSLLWTCRLCLQRHSVT